MEALLTTVGVRVVRTPAAAPNCNAHAERFVRSIKAECLDRVVPLGERHLRLLVREFVAHYREERNHQGIGNELIEEPPVQRTKGPVYRRQRVGGVLNYYYRSGRVGDRHDCLWDTTGMATPRGADRARLRVAANRATASRRAAADVVHRARGDTEILTANFFVTHSHYLDTMLTLREISMRIYKVVIVN